MNFLEMMHIEEEPPIDDEIQPIKAFMDLKVLPTSKVLKLYTTLSSTPIDQLLCHDVQTEAGQMYDELRRSFEMFYRNVNKLTLNVKQKNSCIWGK